MTILTDAKLIEKCFYGLYLGKAGHEKPTWQEQRRACELFQMQSHVMTPQEWEANTECPEDEDYSEWCGKHYQETECGYVVCRESYLWFIDEILPGAEAWLIDQGQDITRGPSIALRQLIRGLEIEEQRERIGRELNNKRNQKQQQRKM